jgi:hypothetical protein
MMKLYISGDRGKAICERCKDVISTTFKYRDVPFSGNPSSDSPSMAKDILVATCDHCDAVVAIPPQSTPSIKAAREIATKSIEVRLPAPYVELLDLASYKIDASATAEFRKRLLAYYIHRLASNEAAAKSFSRSLENLLGSVKLKTAGVPRRRLSFKVTPRLNNEIEEIMETMSLNRTDMFKSLVLQIDKDIVRPKKPKYLAELQTLAAISAS